ncbi:PilZ domain-containing protein [Thiorhodovibrio frisius]|uniref:PilZ domain-containing protein n=1 Tax=Thiorhodovibrio frisius TaxID=631362 RepID=H8Z4A8_9GAMM|nr:PilZ domain-containing protein [Thiorhodovibrio frisius]EIC20165.1 PilZ domain-containing protein [Thiorhodovibrio frisius]WPL20902.1 putative glycosyltransferase [Thiorhodovibrio frisius]
MIHDDDRRGFMRLSTETTASITHLGNQATVKVKLIDLSAGGCSFYADMPLAAGDKLDFVVHGATESIEPLTKRGHVLRLTDGEEGKLVAFAFDE